MFQQYILPVASRDRPLLRWFGSDFNVEFDEDYAYNYVGLRIHDMDLEWSKEEDHDNVGSGNSYDAVRSETNNDFTFYWCESTDGNSGPYETLDEAIHELGYGPDSI